MTSLIEVRLEAIQYAARDINFYRLRPTAQRNLPRAEAGSHIDVYLTAELVRQYSLLTPADSPAEYTIAVKREPNGRGGSNYLFDNLRVGQLLKISPPRNNFPLVEDAHHSVLIAGGIGITPIWAMLQRLRFLGKSWELHYSSRSRGDAILIDDLLRLPTAKLQFDDESGGNYMDISSIVRIAPEGSHLYCCGPSTMLQAFEQATAGTPASSVHVEYFSPKEEADLTGGFTVKLARSSQEFFIPKGKSILEVLCDAGVNVPFSCEVGTCGTCETTVLAGQPNHRDSILTDAERKANNVMMICCSGAKSESLVLDL